MRIVLGISGSIAAYKAADLASQLIKRGHDVHAVMTGSATEFITPLTLQTLTRNPVLVSLEDEKTHGSRVTSSWPIARICWWWHQRVRIVWATSPMGSRLIR